MNIKSKLLVAIIGLLGFTSISAQGNLRAGLLPELAPFYHGVASGDPLSDRVILWTRVTPDSTVAAGDSVLVNWRMASDTGMTSVVTSGFGYASEEKDWTFKTDVSGLSPDECYFYDFQALGKYSIRGRTFTTPVGDIDSLRFALVSCSSYEHGYFNVYRRLLERNDFSAVIHLGDYIYEYDAGGYSNDISGRDYEPTNEIISLTDYRIRHSHYKLDDDLRLLHQQYPFITIWDDHESANDSYKDGAENHTDGAEGMWADRKSYSKQAYHEYMPIRTTTKSDSIYRTINYGDLINLYMLDTRLEGRSNQSMDNDDPNKEMLGATQYNWLTNELDNSTTQWNILGQQVMMAPLKMFGATLNDDQWDGYEYERDQLYSHVINNNIQNMVVLTGDIHTSWANDLPMAGYDDNTGANSAGVEFVCTSVTSPGFPVGFGASFIQLNNDHMKFVDLDHHGYIILDVNKTRTQSDWYFVDDVESVSTNQYFEEGWKVNTGERHLNSASGFSVASPKYNKVYAPAMPLASPNAIIEEQKQIEIFGAYPNPFGNEFTVQYYLFNNHPISIKIINNLGQVVFTDNVEQASKGLNYLKLNALGMAKGTYQLVISTPTQSLSKTLIKSN